MKRYRRPMLPSRRVLLLHPDVGEWDDMRSSPALPLALLHAASLVAQEFEVTIFDRRLHPATWKRELQRLLADDLLLVGATAFTGPMIQSSLDMIALVRSHQPDVPVVWGGIHASLMPEQTVRSPWADYVIQGEGERPLLELARALSEDRVPDGVPGLWRLDGDEAVHTPPAFEPLDGLPDPPWHLVDVAAYLPRYKGRKSLYFQGSRGCPLPCTYCYNVVFNERKWRALSPERVLSQIRHLHEEYGVEDIYFVDDMFFTHLRRAREIARGLVDIPVTWQVQGVDIMAMKRMTDADYELLLESGCSRLTCGIESGSPRVRDYVKKDGTVEDVLETTARLARFPMTLYYSFLCGVPTETRGELKETIDLMLRLTELNPHVHLSPIYNFTPYPGTELFDVAVEMGMPFPRTLEQWARFRHEEWNLFPDRKHFYESLYFTTLFLDDKASDYDAPLPIRLAARAYRPIARFRTKNFFFRGMVERRAMTAAMAAWKTIGRNLAARRPAFT